MNFEKILIVTAFASFVKLAAIYRKNCLEEKMILRMLNQPVAFDDEPDEEVKRVQFMKDRLEQVDQKIKIRCILLGCTVLFLLAVFCLSDYNWSRGETIFWVLGLVIIILFGGSWAINPEEQAVTEYHLACKRKSDKNQKYDRE